MKKKNISKEEDVRLYHRMNSPKQGGNSDDDSKRYLEELGIELDINSQPMQFQDNQESVVHRWAPYVQGFSANFVEDQIRKYKDQYNDLVIIDPFAGCGTVQVQSKLNKYRSYGTELNPLLHYLAKTKISTWDIQPKKILAAYDALDFDSKGDIPEFLLSDKHFEPKILENLSKIKNGITALENEWDGDKRIIDLLWVGLASILIDSSNLVRSPSLGYSRKKDLENDTPFVLFEQKIREILDDLRIIQTLYPETIDIKSEVYLDNANNHIYDEKGDLIITSPPYMNGMDYVINYKIEMSWLGFAEKHKDLRKVKNELVVCDNVSKGLIREFSEQQNNYTNDWIEQIKFNVEKNIEDRGGYRRMDMPHIIHKYFDDMYKIMKTVIKSLKKNGRFVLVVGDSLITDVYIPTDILIARIGNELGLEIESLVKARERRSGQIRSYKLREAIITLIK